MNSPRFLTFTALAAFLLLAACDDHHHTHEERDERTHERLTTSLTVWSEEFEAWVEFEPPIAGQSQTWKTHLTRIDEHAPVRAGVLVYRFEHRDGTTEEHRVDGPVRDGVFPATVALERPGEYRLTLQLQTDDARHTLEPGGVTVTTAPPAHDEAHDGAHEHEDAILFPKVQQWRMPFATATVREEHIAPRLMAPARLEPAPERSARVVLPAMGVLMAPEDRPWPRPGMQVRAGETLARAMPLAGADDVSQLRMDVAQAQERLQLAERELERIRGLHEEGVVPTRRLEETQSDYRLTRQALEQAQTRLARVADRDATDDLLILRAPIDGTIVRSEATPGEVGDTGTALFTLLDDRRLSLRVQLYPSDLHALETADDPLLRLPDGRWLPLQQTAPGVTVREADQRSGTASLTFELDNSDRMLIAGTAVSVAFRTGVPERHLVVPASAVLDDDGVAVVIVQTGGEHFERRVVRTGTRAGGRVAIVDGLDAGERIVTHGAYPVLLAARETTTEIGHDH